MNKCPSCGADLVENNEKFCPNCGTPIVPGEPAPAATVAPRSAAAAPAATTAATAAPAPAATREPLATPSTAPLRRISAPPVVSQNGFRFQGRRRGDVILALWVALALVVLAAIGTGIYYLVEALTD